jgi:hypothetical protein
MAQTAAAAAVRPHVGTARDEMLRRTAVRRQTYDLRQAYRRGTLGKHTDTWP